MYGREIIARTIVLVFIRKYNVCNGPETAHATPLPLNRNYYIQCTWYSLHEKIIISYIYLIILHLHKIYQKTYQTKNHLNQFIIGLTT